MNNVVLMAVINSFHNLWKFLPSFIFIHMSIVNQVLWKQKNVKITDKEMAI